MSDENKKYAEREVARFEKEFAAKENCARKMNIKIELHHVMFSFQPHIREQMGTCCTLVEFNCANYFKQNFDDCMKMYKQMGEKHQMYWCRENK